MEQKILDMINDSTNASWEELYLNADEWKSSMDAYHYDLRFLRNQLHENFDWLIRDVNIRNMHEISKKISKAIVQNQKIVNQIDEHLLKLERLVMSTFIIDNQGLRDENKIIESNFYEFKMNFTMIKLETSFIIEAIEDNKRYHLQAV